MGHNIHVEKETNFRFVYFTKKKNGTEQVLPLFVIDANRIHMQIGPCGTAFTLHGDNGAGEYRSDVVMKALVAMNDTLTTCPPNTPEKNGLAERQWGIVIPAAPQIVLSITYPEQHHEIYGPQYRTSHT